jgi:hypothetical protein
MYFLRRIMFCYLLYVVLKLHIVYLEKQIINESQFWKSEFPALVGAF